MPDRGIPCSICGQYDNIHLKSCHRYPFGSDKEVFVVGWECPICHRGLSPDVTICEHSGVSMDSVMQQLSGSPINFDSWKDLKWYEDDDED